MQKPHAGFTRLIDAHADRRDQRSIVSEFVAGGRLRFASLRFLEDAKFASREVSRSAPHEAVLDALALQCVHSYAELERVTSEVGTDGVINWLDYAEKAAAFSKLLSEARPDGFSEDELNGILAAYNTMIDASNLVRWETTRGRRKD